MQVDLDNLSDVLRNCPHFDRLIALCTGKNPYLVGGALRDSLLGRAVTDLDLIFPDDPTPLAKNFARQIGGHWFWLDQERRQSRVVVNHDETLPHFDFALFRAPDLERDLLDRDFTINALALPLSADFSAADLIDPLHGLDDLQQGRLRMVGKDSLANDPLRVIKGTRHATMLDLKIERATLHAMQAQASGLSRIAPERVRQEVWKTLSSEQATQGLHLLCESGAGAQLFGEGFAVSLPKLTAQLETCRDRWQQLARACPVVRDWLAGEIEQGLSLETLLTWTFLLAAIEPKRPTSLAETWRLSRKAKANIAAVVALDESTLNEFASIARNERAYRWWSARHRIEPKLLLLALAVLAPAKTASPSARIQAWVPLVADLSDQRLSDLVDGHWLRNELHLKDGPEMAKALERLRNAEIFGQVSNEVEAHQYLLRQDQNKD